MNTRRDFVQVAKAIVDAATSETRPQVEDHRNPHAVALSKLGASKGGKARAKSLTGKQRRAIAKKAAQARWNDSR